MADICKAYEGERAALAHLPAKEFIRWWRVSYAFTCDWYRIDEQPEILAGGFTIYELLSHLEQNQ